MQSQWKNAAKNIITDSSRNSETINGFVQEVMAGQKVEKVFNHEKENFKEFCEMNERFRRESTNALAHSGMLVPVIVALSYFNYALSACAGRHVCDPRAHGFGKPVGLSCICETECDAVKSVYTAGQFPVVGALRCRAYF